MKRIKTHKIHNTALLFILIAPFTIAFYASYVFNPFNRGDLWLYILQLLADGIAIINLGTLWLTILLDLIQPEYHKRDIAYDSSWLGKNSLTVDILVPVANEPLEIIINTLENAKNLDYPHTTYVLDDGDSPEVETIAKSLGIRYIARPKHQRSHAKSGNLNYGLKECKGEFFAIFDADHVPVKEFLTELLPFFQNKNVALVQTPQHYINTTKFIAKGTALAQDVFYKYIQPAKNSYNASFCVGTNMLYRRSAIEAIGGIALIDHSEDIWTTILLHEKQWESVYYNKVLAVGRAPETIPAFFQQQNRWAMGGFSLFFKHNPLFIPHLTTDQKLQYFFSNIHYFSAFSILIYLFLPINYMLTGQFSMNVADSEDWLIHYIPYFVTVYFLPLFLLGKFSIATISTALASFSPYIRAFFSVVMKNKYTWVATEARRKKSSPILFYIWPHLFVIVLSLLSIIVGWYNVVDPITSAIITFGFSLIHIFFIFLSETEYYHMHRSLHIAINVLFFTTVIVVACTIATMALVKKIEKDKLQYNKGLTGTVMKQSVPILALSKGVVKKIYIRPGIEVKKNDLLVELDNPVLAGKIEALESYPDNISAQTEAKVAQEEMKGWKLYAPVDGVVTEIYVSEGSPVQELMKIVNIYSNENILLLASLNEEQYAAVQQLPETSAYSSRLNQNFTIEPDILQPDQTVDKFNEKKIGLYFRFKERQEAQSLLNNEDLELNIGKTDTTAKKPIDYVINLWRSLSNTQQ